MMNAVIDAHNISKVYNPNTIPVYAVNNVHLHLERGEFMGLFLDRARFACNPDPGRVLHVFFIYHSILFISVMLRQVEALRLSLPETNRKQSP